jgi:hypothetical protein
MKQVPKQSRRKAAQNFKEKAMKVKTRRKLTDEEKVRRRVVLCERKTRAAQLEVKCSHCGEQGKILHEQVPPLRSALPLWLVGNDWLIQDYPLCADCIENGARAAVCVEGNNLRHNVAERAGDGHEVCIDCGHDCDDEKEGDAGWPDEAIIRGRLEEAVASREAAIEYLVEYLPTLSSGPALRVLTTRLQRLIEDRDWTVRRLADQRR